MNWSVEIIQGQVIHHIQYAVVSIQDHHVVLGENRPHSCTGYSPLSRRHHRTSPVPWYDSASVGQGDLTPPSWLHFSHPHHRPRLRNHHL